MKFTVILAPETRGGFSAPFARPCRGCISEGDSRTDTLANIREAIILCLEVRKQEGHPSPVETPELVAEEIRARLKDRAAEGLPLTIETQVVDVAAEVAA